MNDVVRMNEIIAKGKDATWKELTELMNLSEDLKNKGFDVALTKDKRKTPASIAVTIMYENGHREVTAEYMKQAKYLKKLLEKREKEIV